MAGVNLSEQSNDQDLQLLTTVYLVGELCERGATPELLSSTDESGQTVNTIQTASQDGQLRFRILVTSQSLDESQSPVRWEIWQKERCFTSGELFFEVLNQDLNLAWEVWCNACCTWGMQRFPANLLDAVEAFAAYYDLD